MLFALEKSESFGFNKQLVLAWSNKQNSTLSPPPHEKEPRIKSELSKIMAVLSSETTAQRRHINWLNGWVKEWYFVNPYRKLQHYVKMQTAHTYTRRISTTERLIYMHSWGNKKCFTFLSFHSKLKMYTVVGFCNTMKIKEISVPFVHHCQRATTFVRGAVDELSTEHILTKYKQGDWPWATSVAKFTKVFMTEWNPISAAHRFQILMDTFLRDLEPVFVLRFPLNIIFSFI